MATTHTVVKGDTLWDIAEKYLGSGSKYTQLAAINGIKNPDLIYIGQVIKLTNTGSSSTKSTSSSKVTIKHFGLQANVDNVLFVTWDWSKSNTENYQVRWDYYTDNKYWFVGNESTTTYQYSTYNIPSNAKQVRVRIKPVSKKYTKNNKEHSYWSAGWTSWKKHTVSNPPKTPSTPTVTLEGLKLTASVSNLEGDPTIIQFEVTKDDKAACNTGKAAVKTATAAYSCNLTAGSKYKVRCRAYKDGLYSDWSAYTNNYETIPATPTEFTKCSPKTETSIILEWAAIPNATSYDIEYTTVKSNFDGSDAVSSKTGITTTSYEITSGIESGKEYFFRLRAVNAQGTSGWSEISSSVLGTTPAAPTTWSSTTTVITGEPLNLYWVHNSKDGSSQTYAHLEIRDNTDTILIEKHIPNDRKEEDKDKTSTYEVKMVDDEGNPIYTDGTVLKWRVRTAGVDETYGEWSVQRAVNIYAPPTLELSVTDSTGNTFETLESLPFKITALAGPNTQAPIGYHLSIISKELYETVDNMGNEKIVNEGEAVYSKYFDINDKLEVELSASDLTLENGVEYTISCTVAMDSGLDTEASTDFTVDWTELEYMPNAEISIDDNTFSAYIKPYCANYAIVNYKVTKTYSQYYLTTEVIDAVYGSMMSGVRTTTGEQVYSGTSADGDSVYYTVVEESRSVDDVILAVYRREFDGNFTELATEIDGAQNVTITDPHPSLDYARYRIVAKSKDTGTVSYYDVPGYEVGGKAAIIQWDEEWTNFDVPDTSDDLGDQVWTGSLLKLPYNIDVSDKHSSDVALIEYVGRKHPVTYYGTHLGESSTWNMEIPKDDKDTLYALRRLAVWMGDVYVREPSGSGYWANITVSFSQKHCAVTIPVTIEVVRVEGGK